MTIKTLIPSVVKKTHTKYFFSLCFCLYYICPTLSLSDFSSSRPFVTQVRGHIVGSFPSSPLRFVPCIFIARRLKRPFFSHRLAWNFAPLPALGALSAVDPLLFLFSSFFFVFFFLRICSKSYHGGIGTPGPTLQQ